MVEQKMVVVARILRAVGTAGWVEVEAHTDDPARFAPGSALAIQPPTDARSSVVVSDNRPRGSRVQLRLEGLETRTEAEQLIGRYVAVDREELRDLPEGEFWVHDIVGCRVMLEDGSPIGEVVEVLVTGSNDVYVVRGAEAEVLIPATKEVVLTIETASKRIVIRPLPGLLDEPTARGQE